MEDNVQLVQAQRMLSHIDQVAKTYKMDKQKDARELLLRQAFEGGEAEMDAVQKFKKVMEVLHVYIHIYVCTCSQ